MWAGQYTDMHAACTTVQKACTADLPHEGKKHMHILGDEITYAQKPASLLAF